MKKHALLFLVSILFIGRSFAQSERVIGPAEKKITDSVCECLTKLDMSKITTKDGAIAAYEGCVTSKGDLIVDVAKERNVDMTDLEGMKKVGVDIAMNLMKNKCDNFMKLGVVMAKGKVDNGDNIPGSTLGTLKRIDNKGFNYFVITEGSGSERSFLWLRQFPGSEKFTNGLIPYLNKKVLIKWQEIEVYLPVAKGYYKVKEITGLSFL